MVEVGITERGSTWCYRQCNQIRARHSVVGLGSELRTGVVSKSEFSKKHSDVLRKMTKRFQCLVRGFKGTWGEGRKGGR
jgi:hypothetical protein